MAQFHDLSAELILCILEQVSPDDIVSVSLASKRIHQLALPRLDEHRRLRKRYTNFSNMVEYKPLNWGDPGGLLADLLCKIMSDTRTGHYVKKIDLHRWNSDPKDGWKPDAIFAEHATTSRPRAQQCSMTNMEIIKEAIRATGIIPTEEVDDWLHQIRRGNEDPIVALLLLHAPRLHTLQFFLPYPREKSSFILKAIQRIVASEFSIKLHSSHLRVVRLGFAEGWNNFDMVKAFMSLPSLTSITTNSLYVDDRTYEATLARLPRPSNVRAISFEDGFLPGLAFSELMKGMENLNKFSYSFGNLWTDTTHRSPFDCLALIRSLEANAAYTLEHLTLRAPKIMTSHIALRRFHALRDISFHTSRCFAVQDSWPRNFGSSLPLSLERLALHWTESSPVDTFSIWIEAILGFARESRTNLPRLRMLHLATMDRRESDALWDHLDFGGAAQTNPELSFYIRGRDREGEIRAWSDNKRTGRHKWYRDKWI